MTAVILLLFEILVMVHSVRVSGPSDVGSDHNIPESRSCDGDYAFLPDIHP